jgi:superfamily II DNA or RNA helicase
MRFDLDLRPYQTALIEDVRHSFRSGKRSPLLQLPTGGGKTVLTAFILASSAHRGRSAAFLVHRKELIAQTSKTLHLAGVPHGVIHPDWPTTRHLIQVASVQTLVRRLHRHRKFDTIVIDEAHHSVAGTWRKILDHYGNAALLGLTATPARLDGKGLGIQAGGVFDDLVIGPSMMELIEGGFLARPKVFASERHLDLSGIHTRAGDFAADEVAEVMNRREIVGDAVAHYEQHLPGKRAIAFCASVEHAANVAATFNARGIPARRLDGTLSSYERSAAVEGFAAGEIKVLTSCELISEGFDVPGCDGALLLRPTQSESLYLQMVGRALRPAPGKPFAVILDHVGNVARHGLPQEAREWTLDGRRRRESPPETKQCPGCFAVLPSYVTTCPECEHSFGEDAERRRAEAARSRELESVNGNLIELTPEMIAAAAAAKARRMQVGMARTREQLEAIARERGYRMGWVDRMLAARGQRR